MDEMIACMLGSEENSEPLPLKLAAILFLVRIYFRHGSPVSESAATKCYEGGQERLPFAEVERDRTDKQDADRRRDTGPFDAFHLTVLARPWERRQVGGAPNRRPAEITHRRRHRAAARACFLGIAAFGR
ncbi:MAG: hypothetical protein P4M05_16120 [Bradyrhizobium sp.]|nr:hypothetical protein [Bradyrhizobium sp.]